MLTHNHRKLIARLGLAVGLATLGAPTVPTASADTGPPQGSGGCHMVTSPSATGLNQMMANASGAAAQNMQTMLSKFSSEPFCGA